MLTLTGVAALCAGLAHNPTLRRLDLENKGLTAAALAALAQVLLSADSGLRGLLLSRNDLGPEGESCIIVGCWVQFYCVSNVYSRPSFPTMYTHSQPP
jgi:hypothetical protein